MHVFVGVVLMKESDIIIVDASVSLKPYLKDPSSFEAKLEEMGFEVAEEKPKRKIGFLPALER